MYVSSVEASRDLVYEIDSQRGAYLYLVNGKIDVNELQLSKGDAAMVTHEQSLRIRAGADSEFVLFDVPMAG